VLLPQEDEKAKFIARPRDELARALEAELDDFEEYDVCAESLI
jgi:hypothetical protein